MNEQIFKDYSEQFDKIFGGTARAYGALALSHAETIFNIQLEAARAHSDIGIKRARAALELRTPEDVQAYIKDQQEVGREIGERVKSDAEKLVSLNQEFVQKARSLSEESAGNLNKAAKSNVRKATAKAAS
ncbi:phasin family protein [Natronocella acetinitrilica]|jgi:phasin family protein|uniref:Phasin family protein n=1 Tax=Natronocella acetinitrilica TaxID=414046 RepID=A0AAE3G8S8_9GAMM|nr:phasin family protein [Natronocella acetinitrilica]MCP1677114.1 phasin family protein [Natronocella acetinitrilica]